MSRSLLKDGVWYLPHALTSADNSVYKSLNPYTFETKKGEEERGCSSLFFFKLKGSLSLDPPQKNNNKSSKIVNSDRKVPPTTKPHQEYQNSCCF